MHPCHPMAVKPQNIAPCTGLQCAMPHYNAQQCTDFLRATLHDTILTYVQVSDHDSRIKQKLSNFKGLFLKGAYFVSAFHGQVLAHIKQRVHSMYYIQFDHQLTLAYKVDIENIIPR